MVETRGCVECGGECLVTELDVEFYVQRGMSVPKRCRACRALRRQWKQEAAQALEGDRARRCGDSSGRLGQRSSNQITN